MVRSTNTQLLNMSESEFDSDLDSYPSDEDRHHRVPKYDKRERKTSPPQRRKKWGYETNAPPSPPFGGVKRLDLPLHSSYKDPPARGDGPFGGASVWDDVDATMIDQQDMALHDMKNNEEINAELTVGGETEEAINAALGVLPTDARHDLFATWRRSSESMTYV